MVCAGFETRPGKSLLLWFLSLSLCLSLALSPSLSLPLSPMYTKVGVIALPHVLLGKSEW